MGEDSCSEENFTLTHPIEIGVQLQTFDLIKKGKLNRDHAQKLDMDSSIRLLTISIQACFPSIKPLGMALGVRISYLREGNMKTFSLNIPIKEPDSLDLKLLPLSKLLENDAVGKALPTDTDSFQNPIAS